MTRKYDVAAYIWPSYHYEPRVEHFWPEKDGEWYTVRRGTPRFSGHDMPRIPLLGHQDEAEPKVMRQQVELAMAHGINVFIMDWYWYANLPCFERQLNEGLIPALKGTDCKFYLMWANHDVDTLWNMHVDTDWTQPRPNLWSGQVSRTVLEPMFERIVDKYFGLANYYRIADKPVFSIFDYPNLIPHKTAHAPRQRLAQAGASSPRPRRGSTVSIPHAGSTYSSLWQALSGTSHRQASVTPTCHAIVRSTTAEGVTHRCGLQPHSFGKASQDRSASP